MIRFEKGELEIWMAQSKKAQQQGQADIFILRFHGNADIASPGFRFDGLEIDQGIRVLDWQRFGGALAELNAVQPRIRRGATRFGQHRWCHIDTNDVP